MKFNQIKMFRRIFWLSFSTRTESEKKAFPSLCGKVRGEFWGKGHPLLHSIAVELQQLPLRHRVASQIDSNLKQNIGFTVRNGGKKRGSN